jgi:hypothetical protein
LGTPQVRREITSSVEVWSSDVHLTTFMLNTKSLSANETIISKTKFERLAKSNGVQISGYHSDNGVFKAEFEGRLSRDKVSSSLVLEPSGRMELLRTQVKIVTWKARALMIHASLHWPEDDPAVAHGSILCCSPLQQHSQQRIRHCSSRNLHRHQVRLPGPQIPWDVPLMSFTQLCKMKRIQVGAHLAVQFLGVP